MIDNLKDSDGKKTTPLEVFTKSCPLRAGKVFKMNPPF
jgi:hypothetical protein